MKQTQKQKVISLINNSILISPEERKYWLQKVDKLSAENLKNLEKIFNSEKDGIIKLFKEISKSDPEGKLFKEFDKAISTELGQMRDIIENKEKASADKKLEQALKNL